MKQCIGVDIGGTYIKAGIVSDKGKIIRKTKIDTVAEKGRKKVIENIKIAISSLMDKGVSAIGIGCPGIINPKNGIVIKSPNLPFKNLPLKKIIKDKFNLPVFLDNDAACFTLAEAVFGAGKGYKTVAGVTIGTGIGGGISINKKIYHGKRSDAEIGHTEINSRGPKCTCGSRGCLEEYASARAIMRRANGLLAKNPLEVSILARKGSNKAKIALEETGKYLGIGITNFVDKIDPDIVVVGGQISNSWDLFSKRLKDEIKKRGISQNCRIVRKRLSEPGIIGAAALGFD